MALIISMMGDTLNYWDGSMSCQSNSICFVQSMRIMLMNIGFLCSSSHVESYPAWLSSPTQVQRALPSVEFVEEAMLLLDLRMSLNRPTPLLLVSSPTTSSLQYPLPLPPVLRLLIRPWSRILLFNLCGFRSILLPIVVRQRRKRCAGFSCIILS